MGTRDRRSNHHVICLKERWHSQNDCFKIPSINSLIFSTLCPVNEKLYECEYETHIHHGRGQILSMITTNSNNISVCLLSHSHMIFKFIILLYFFQISACHSPSLRKSIHLLSYIKFILFISPSWRGRRKYINEWREVCGLLAAGLWQQFSQTVV